MFRSLMEDILDNGEMIAVAVSESGDQEYSGARGWHHAKGVPKLPYLTQWVIIRGQVFGNAGYKFDSFTGEHGSLQRTLNHPIDASQSLRYSVLPKKMIQRMIFGSRCKRLWRWLLTRTESGSGRQCGSVE
ncbi:MAG: hypothetical protein IPJ68_05785 [Candidatus Moraniibacteriota bacterium]|nr:MAG: hypothetical protein IPJ68_05785 [Candidatus Moranbacteria bacterium]